AGLGPARPPARGSRRPPEWPRSRPAARVWVASTVVSQGLDELVFRHLGATLDAGLLRSLVELSLAEGFWPVIDPAGCGGPAAPRLSPALLAAILGALDARS